MCNSVAGREQGNFAACISGQHLSNHGTFDIGQTTLNSIMFKGQPLVIQAQQMQQRGAKIIQRVDIFHRPAPQLIRHPMTDPRPHTRPG